MNRIAAVIVVSLMTFVTCVQAQNSTIAPAGLPAQKVVLVELFTSEGCSSCPPADALLRQVNGTTTSAGQLIVGISEHVTYWNALGWTDPFSSPANTDRQNDYGARFHLEGVYTPQMVINGSEEIVGSDRGAFTRAVEKEVAQAPLLSLHILSLTVAANTVTVTYSAMGELPRHGADLIAVVADDADRSHVLRGENSGQLIDHVAVVRSLTRVARLQSAGQRSVQLQLPPAFQAGQKHHLILFAQTSGNGRVLGADTKPL